MTSSEAIERMENSHDENFDDFIDWNMAEAVAAEDSHPETTAPSPDDTWNPQPVNLYRQVQDADGRWDNAEIVGIWDPNRLIENSPGPVQAPEPEVGPHTPMSFSWESVESNTPPGAGWTGGWEWPVNLQDEGPDNELSEEDGRNLRTRLAELEFPTDEQSRSSFRDFVLRHWKENGNNG